MENKKKCYSQDFVLYNPKTYCLLPLILIILFIIDFAKLTNKHEIIEFFFGFLMILFFWLGI